MNDNRLHNDTEQLVLHFLSVITGNRNHTKGIHTAPMAHTFAVLDILDSFWRLGGGGGSFHCTERDIYYRAPLLFGSQRTVHAALERLCAWLTLRAAAEAAGPAARPPGAELFTRAAHHLRRSGTDTGTGPRARAGGYTRESLGVTPAGRSTLVGALAVTLLTAPSSSSSYTVDLATSYGREGLLVTSDIAARFVSASFTAASGDGGKGGVVVFVEKECVLQTLLTTEAAGRRRPRYAFLCSRGYPCVAARALLRRWHSADPSLPLAALADGDPHGIAIVLTLMGHRAPRGGEGEGSEGGEAPALLPVRWVGVRASQVRSPGACLPLAASDERLLVSLGRRLQQLRATQRDATVLRTLADMAAEVAWMRRTKLKCEVQQATRPRLGGGGGGRGPDDGRPAEILDIIDACCAPLLT